jgi:Lrp/AsnC family transcriptional regulator for asnA, asnC and gidA
LHTNNDSIDAIILKMLLKESRTSFTEIARECKISVSAARARYNHLKKVGIINGEIMQVNPYGLGYKCVGNIGINTSGENEETVIEALKKKHLRSSSGCLGENITLH